MFPHFNTVRLTIRPFKFSDAKEVAQFLDSTLVAQSLPSIRRPYTKDHARDWIATHPFELAQHGNYHLALELKSTKGLVGAVGLSPRLHKHWAEIGYWIAPSYWNQGLCTEALNPFFRYTFTKLKIPQIRAFCHPENTASIRVLDKCGFVAMPFGANGIKGTRGVDPWVDKATGHKMFVLSAPQ